MTNRDEVAELADRIEERRRRGRGLRSRVRVDRVAHRRGAGRVHRALRQRTAHSAEVLAGLEENVRILKLLIGWQAGVMTTLEFVERVQGAVPDPLAE